MRDRIPLLARGDRNNPIAREPPLAERIRVVARSGYNNFVLLGGSAVTSSHEVTVVDLGRAGAEHRGRRAVARRREFDCPPDGGDVLGAGTAMVYPTLLAVIGDVAHPAWRASAVGVYRLWRDAGFAVGALMAGVIADRFGMPAAIWVVAALTGVSGVIVLIRMYVTHPAESRRPSSESTRPVEVVDPRSLP
jgi:MFS family permease